MSAEQCSTLSLLRGIQYEKCPVVEEYFFHYKICRNILPVISDEVMRRKQNLNLWDFYPRKFFFGNSITNSRLQIFLLDLNSKTSPFKILNFAKEFHTQKSLNPVITQSNFTRGKNLDISCHVQEKKFFPAFPGNNCLHFNQ